MTKRLQIRKQIIEDRLNNPENLWLYENLSYNRNLDINVIDTNNLYNYGYLSDNPRLTVDVINKHKDKDWNWKFISQNSNITFEIIQNNPDLPWNWDYISVNKNITWSIVIDNLQYPWDWVFLSVYKPITWDIIKSNIDLFINKIEWDLCGGSFGYNMNYIENIKFDFEILENLVDVVPWNYNNLSSYSMINWDIVMKFKDKPWNWYLLSDSDNLDWNIILKYIDLPWNWNLISLNLKVTSLILSTNQNWNWNYLSYNKSITDEILQDHLDKPWNWDNLSSNCQNSITKEFILNNPDKPWDYNKLGYYNVIIIDKITNWRIISRNCNLSFEFILEHINKFIRDGDWEYLSRNNNITYEYVSNNRNLPWDWSVLSGNKNMLDIEVEFKLKAREHMAAYKILQYWLRSYYNPEYLICKRRLYNEFKNLTRV
jgi:hypothetical protein